MRENAPTWSEVLANTIIYFTFPNPDGWRRGSIGDTDKGPGVFFQRYNGNGIDPNRDWPDIGFSFRPYSGGSEPETRAFQRFYEQVEERGGQFAAGDDLHGQPFADALSYTLMPHGRHDIDKDYRIREASKLINRAQYHATKWSPYIIDNDQEATHCQSSTLGSACDAIYAQTWGSVYDTINYTTTGTLGDWFDSSVGLGADGIDNEMSFSHLDRNIAFEPHGEQLHVAGNKAIIYSHIADMLRPPSTAYATDGRNAYVPNQRLTREESAEQPGPPPGTSPQDDESGDAIPGPDGSAYEFTVQRDKDTFNGGMRIDVRTSNVQGIGPGVTILEVQCRGCDEHIRPEDAAADDWITVAEDYNQSPLYAQAGLTAAVNRPDATKPDGKAVEWRALVSAEGGLPTVSIDFTSDPATSDGTTGGDTPPRLAGYDVANTDFFGDLNQHALADNDRFSPIDPAKVLDGSQTFEGIETLVLADNPMPGYTGVYKGEAALSAPPTPNFTFAHSQPTAPSQTDGCVETPATSEVHEFTISPDNVNGSMKVTISWSQPTSDYDLYVYSQAYGRRQLAGSSAGFLNTSESVTVPNPNPGDYEIVVINCSAPSEADPWSGTAEFKPRPATATSAFTPAQKDAYMAKLKSWVEAGGNLVLTDGALRGLPELTSVPGTAILPQTVYVGQSTFRRCETFADDPGACQSDVETLDDPLAKNVAQPGARFNTGMRRQMYESTPLGFAIQNEEGADASFARQYDVDQQAFAAAGGRVVGASVDAGARDAGPVLERTTLGEIAIGQGHVRIAGALLPQPSTEYDHPLGLEPYAVTYTGYLVFCNLVDCRYEPKQRPPLQNRPAPPGPVKIGFSAKLKTPLLASKKTRNGKRVKLKVKAKHRKRIKRFKVQYRKTGRGTNRTFKKFKPRLKAKKRRIFFKKGKIGRTYLFRIRAVGKKGVKTDWRYRRLVFPYEDKNKRMRYSAGWTRVEDRRAWRRGYHESSTRGARMRFKVGRGGRFYLVGRKSPDGGVAVIRRGFRRKVVSFRGKRVRNRRVVAVFNGSPRKKYRLVVRVRRGPVAIDGIGVRRR